MSRGESNWHTLKREHQIIHTRSRNVADQRLRENHRAEWADLRADNAAFIDLMYPGHLGWRARQARIVSLSRIELRKMFPVEWDALRQNAKDETREMLRREAVKDLTGL